MNKVFGLVKSIVFVVLLVFPLAAQVSTANDRSPQTAKVFFDRGRGYLTSGKYLEAAEEYRKGLVLSPKNTSALIGLGDALRKIKQFDAALDAYKRALALQPGDNHTYGSMAFIYSTLERHEEAIAASEQAIVLNGKDELAYTNLGYSLTKLGRYEEALSPLKKAMELTPNDIGLHNNLGEVYFRLGRYDESAEILQQAIRLKPDDFWPRMNITNVYCAQGNLLAAVKELKEAARINPDDFRTYLRLASVANSAGLYQDAIDAYTQLIRLKPQEANAFLSRGYSYLSIGQGDFAAKDALRYLEFSKGGNKRDLYAVIVAYLGYKQAKRDQEARGILSDSTIKMDTKSWPYQVVRFLRQEITAKELLVMAVDGDKKTEAYAYIGMELALSDHPDEARTYLGWVKENGNKNFDEYPLAISQLNRPSRLGAINK